MEEAKDYKAYLKALKEMTKKKNTSAADFIKRRKQLNESKNILLWWYGYRH